MGRDKSLRDELQRPSISKIMDQAMSTGSGPQNEASNQKDSIIQTDFKSCRANSIEERFDDELKSPTLVKQNLTPRSRQSQTILEGWDKGTSKHESPLHDDKEDGPLITAAL